MIFPTINDLNKGQYNRYEVALATAKCARMITNEYVRQRAEAEYALTGNKENDRPLNSMIEKEVRDEKAVNIAVRRMYEGKYVITHKTVEEQEREEKEVLDGILALSRPHDDRDRDRDEDEPLPSASAAEEAKAAKAAKAAEDAAEAAEDAAEGAEDAEDAADTADAAEDTEEVTETEEVAAETAAETAAEESATTEE